MTTDENFGDLDDPERLVDRLPVGVFRSTLDGELIDVNPAFVSLVGADSEAHLLEHDASDFYADPAERRRLVEKLHREGVVTDEEVQITTLDGERIWVSTTLMLREHDGEQFLEGITQDVTCRKERERKLKRYQGMVDTMRDSACIYDEEGRFVVVNDYLAEFYGTTKEALEGERSYLVEHVRETGGGDADRDDQGARRDPYERLVAGEIDELRGEYESVYPGHGHSVVDYRFTRLTDDGRFEGVVAIGRDVTDRKQRERQLEQTNERLQAFSSIVSHDLRNPLSVAEGRLELARTECDSEHLDKVAQAHDRMDALIEDMLTLARENDPAVDTDPVDLADLVETCWGNVRTDDARLVTTVESTITADRARLQRLFENLFRNAVEHGSTGPRSQAREDSVEHGSTSNRTATQSGDSVEHGSTGSQSEGDTDDADDRTPVTITVGEVDGSTGFYVADDGPGIPPEDRDRVFESGYSTQESGTGFGLAIVESIADAHGWTVRVTEGDDGGARFEFTGVERAS
ncbi:PAS domain-containing sensor histidine kinase [Salinigranum sp. GCM10025319]|uniref:PAS domain-containing sensor histidine kinase n=1 Tax=Salinigranum sp. GCM10025319 TaxID=3252687 RepID=UPI00361A3EB1